MLILFLKREGESSEVDGHERSTHVPFPAGSMMIIYLYIYIALSPYIGFHVVAWELFVIKVVPHLFPVSATATQDMVMTHFQARVTQDVALPQPNQP